jgi:cell wall-associated protease
MAYGQISAQAPKLSDSQLKTWYHSDFATTGIHGVATQKAYQFLDSKKIKPNTVTVAVIDSGVEIDHVGLKNNIWQNTKEIEGNMIDDDNNGYIDDKYGWNFLGNKSGENVTDDTLEVTRTYKTYQLVFEGPDADKNAKNIKEQAQAYADYQKAKAKINGKVEEAKQNAEGYRKIKADGNSIFALLKGENLTKETLNKIQANVKDGATYRLFSMLEQMYQRPEFQGKTPAEAKVLFEQEINDAIHHFDGEQKNYDPNYNSRIIVGDNENNLTEKGYGNNHYEGPDALHGTHVSGIIAGQTNGSESQYGVAHKVAKIMSIRAVPNGDERDKDIANAIIYAVDNGAKVINMSFGKGQSPHKERVWEAYKYAEKKDVLLVHAAGNEGENLNKDLKFPTNYLSENDKPIVSNHMAVGASTNDPSDVKADFSNFNKVMVDVFAPGDKIYASVPDNKYRYLQGTSMAAPVVAGAAAVLRAYFPNLTAQQTKEALEKTVNKAPKTKGFETYSRSGGVIDLYKAAVYAYQKFYQKSK